MKIRRARFYRYTLPLARPLVLKNVTITQRHGLIIGLEAKGGAVGYGECAPLPAFSFENVEWAHAAAFVVTEFLRKEGFDYDESLYGPCPWQRAFPSVRFALETAFLQLRAAQRGKSLVDMLGVPARDTVSINGLLVGSREEVLEQAKHYANLGYRAVKLKVGRDALHEDIDLVRAVRDVVGPAATLRLDANQAWMFEDAVRFAKAVADCAIEYIEEPLRDAAYLAQLFDETGTPYAIDETLTQVGWLRILQWLREGVLARQPGSGAPNQLAATVRDAAAWVIKPTLAGLPPLGLFRDLAQGAVTATLVVSGSFESGLGAAALATLAACLNRSDVPAGLDTYNWLARDVIAPPLSWTQGTLRLSDAVAAMARFKPDGLEELLEPPDA
jgi:o-succinylbenzoate synthase